MQILSCKIPRNIIEQKNGMLLILYCYISFNRTIKNQLFLNSNHVFDFLKFSIKQQKKSTVEFSNALFWLEENDFLTKEFSSDKTRTLSNIYNLNFDKFNPVQNYTIVYDIELNKLFSNTSFNKSTKYQLLLLLSYIRINMAIRSKQTFHTQKNIQHKPQVFFVYKKKLKDFLNISDKTLLKLINILRDNELIEYQILPRFQDQNDNWHTHFTIFADKHKYKWNNYHFTYQKDMEYNANKEILAGIENVINKYKGKDIENECKF